MTRFSRLNHCFELRALLLLHFFFAWSWEKEMIVAIGLTERATTFLLRRDDHGRMVAVVVWMGKLKLLFFSCFLALSRKNREEGGKHVAYQILSSSSLSSSSESLSIQKKYMWLPPKKTEHAYWISFLPLWDEMSVSSGAFWRRRGASLKLFFLLRSTITVVVIEVVSNAFKNYPRDNILQYALKPNWRRVEDILRNSFFIPPENIQEMEEHASTH